MKKNLGKIIGRYAQALFDASLESKELEAVSKQAEGLAQVFSPEMVSFFVNPGIDLAKKKALLQEIGSATGTSSSVLRFFDLLLDNHRFLVVSEILKAFVVQADAKLGIARVDLVTASALSAVEAAEFSSVLEKALSKKIILKQKTDPSLKAGCVVKIGNTLIDASLQARLQSIKESLSQGV